MSLKLLQDSAVYDALYEIDRIEEAKQTSENRNNMIQQLKINKDLKNSLNIRHEKLSELLDKIITDKPEDEEYELLCATCSICNRQIYRLYSKTKWWQKIIHIRKHRHIMEQTREIFEAMGERSASQLLFNRYGETITSIVATTILAVLVFLGLLIWVLIDEKKSWLSILGVIAYTAILLVLWIGIEIPIFRDKGLPFMAARVYDRHTYFNKKKRQELSQMAEKIDVVQKAKDLLR